MKIAHVSTIHKALDSRIFYKECRTLGASGYQVFLIVQEPLVETDSGVNFIEIPSVRSGHRLTLLITRFWGAFYQSVQLNAVIYHVHDPELILLGLILKLMGKTVIYDVHEDTPQQALSLNLDNPIEGYLKFFIWSFVEALAKLLLDAFVCATDTITQKYPRKRSITVYNFCQLEEFTSAAAEALADCDRARADLSGCTPKIIYIGRITLIRGVREMLQALPLITSASDVEFLLAGEFDTANTQTLAMKLPGWKHTQYVGWQSRESIQSLLASAKIGLVLLHPVPNYLVSYPIKLFEYMAAGLPVIASDFPLWRSLIEPIDCGLLVDPLDPTAIAQAIQYLLDNPDIAEKMGQRGQQAVKTQYNWDNEATKLLQLYDKLNTSRA